jgi:anti-sigma regulatory factor (Ser/Thr protein kinase)
MRSGAAAGHTGYFHEAAFYSSDDELLDLVVPFLEGGIAAGEPTLMAFGSANEKLVRSVMDVSKLTVIPGTEQYLRPAVAIRSYREALAGYVAGGATQIRAVGEVPHPGHGELWDWWSRYEAVVNRAYDDFPIWGLCPYDTRITPDHVLGDVRRTHPNLVGADGRHLRNDEYQEPASFLPSWQDAPRPVLPDGPPLAELTDPSAADARQAVRVALAPANIDPARTQDFVMAVSEVVTNGFVHGRPPLRVRIWRESDSAVVTVTDGGGGPADPFAGLVAAQESRSAGVGLWMAHQICRHVAMYGDDEGFVVRLVC